MKRFIPLLCILLLACKEKYPPVPKDIIQTGKMEKILGDMLIADALSETRGIGTVSEKQYTESYYATIFKNYGVNRELFIKSYHFYEDNPVILNNIYDSVLSDISKREAAIGK